jgi:hypothetical protein
MLTVVMLGAVVKTLMRQSLRWVQEMLGVRAMRWCYTQLCLVNTAIDDAVVIACLLPSVGATHGLHALSRRWQLLQATSQRRKRRSLRVGWTDRWTAR